MGSKKQCVVARRHIIGNTSETRSRLRAYFLMSYDDWVNPTEPGKFRCGMPMIGLYIGNTIFMIPITQGLLALFNLYFKNYKQDKKTNK